MSGQVETRSPTRLAAAHSKPAVVAAGTHVDSHAVTKRLQVGPCCTACAASSPCHEPTAVAFLAQACSP